MLPINKLEYTTFAQNNSKKKLKMNNLKENNIDMFCTATIAATSACVITAGILSKKSLNKVLDSNGIILKDGIAVVKETGKEFTGTIKRNVEKFWNKREVIKYKDGQIEEKLYYNLFGKELNGYFYKNGELYKSIDVNAYPSSKNKLYSLGVHRNGQLDVMLDGRYTQKGSVFEAVRKGII